MIEFDHEKLAVYVAAIDFIALADDVVERLPRGRAYLADQLQRAATSIALNIAEGAGEYSRKDKARFYSPLGWCCARRPNVPPCCTSVAGSRSLTTSSQPLGVTCCHG